MARYWTSDLHLGHANIIRYCGRPFTDADKMNTALVDRWNETVGSGDEVWVLGDFALGKITDTLALVQKLHGRKVLVPGNHDRCWAGHSKMVDKWTTSYLEAGFDEIVQAPTSIELAGRQVLVDHFPYHGDSRDDGDRYAERRPLDRGGWLLHGHVHERWLQKGRQINVGVDPWAGRPVSDDDLAALIDTGRMDIAALPWT